MNNVRLSFLSVLLLISGAAACGTSAPPPACLDEGETPRESCEDSCSNGVSCGVFQTTIALCTEICECTVRSLSAECATAREAWNTCLAGLSCQELEEFFTPSADEFPCMEEVEADRAVCTDDGIPTG